MHKLTRISNCTIRRSELLGRGECDLDIFRQWILNSPKCMYIQYRYDPLGVSLDSARERRLELLMQIDRICRWWTTHRSRRCSSRSRFGCRVETRCLICKGEYGIGVDHDVSVQYSSACCNSNRLTPQNKRFQTDIMIVNCTKRVRKINGKLEQDDP